MKDIALALGLPESATAAEILAAIETLQAQNADLRSAASGIPKGISPAEVAAKMAAGLTKEQAIEVIAAQAEQDKAAAPKPKK